MTIQSIGLFEAKTHLSELVARAEQGEEVIITRHNKPVARIVPMADVLPFDREQRRAAVAGIHALREELRQRHGPISTEDIVGLIRESRDERAEQIWHSATRPQSGK